MKNRNQIEILLSELEYRIQKNKSELGLVLQGAFISCRAGEEISISKLYILPMAVAYVK